MTVLILIVLLEQQKKHGQLKTKPLSKSDTNTQQG
jgi:hypothetical protein